MECLKVAVGHYGERLCCFRLFAKVHADDYNAWQETPGSERFKDKLDTEVIVVEGAPDPTSEIREKD